MDISTNRLCRSYLLLKARIVMLYMAFRILILCSQLPNEFEHAGFLENLESERQCCGSCGAVGFRNLEKAIWLCDSKPTPYPTTVKDT